ncbi:hypothetical protein [Enterococcus alishanensis]
MLKKLSTVQLVGILLIGAIIWLSVSLYNQQKKLSVTTEKYQVEVKNLKDKNTEATNRVSELSEQYDRLYAEKNGTANEQLLSASKKLFSAVYNYDTSDEKQSVASRKNEASAITSEGALEALFPKDADTIAYSVTTVSTLDSNPECYLMSSDDSNLKALVVIKNTISIADSENLSDSYIYRVVFDTTRNQFVEITSLGNVKL